MCNNSDVSYNENESKKNNETDQKNKKNSNKKDKKKLKKEIKKNFKSNIKYSDSFTDITSKLVDALLKATINYKCSWKLCTSSNKSLAHNNYKLYDLEKVLSYCSDDFLVLRNESITTVFNGIRYNIVKTVQKEQTDDNSSKKYELIFFFSKEDSKRITHLETIKTYEQNCKLVKLYETALFKKHKGLKVVEETIALIDASLI